MAYQEPGVSQEQQLNPVNLAIIPQASTLAIVGIAPRVKTASNELVRRGQIRNEAVTFSGVAPFQATLAHRANRKQQDSVLVRNGTDVIPDSGYFFVNAQVTGPAGPFVIPANSYLTVSIDGRQYISIPLTAGGAQTAANVAADINAALAGSPFYGAGYATAASAVGAAVRIDSPEANRSKSDIRFIVTPADTAPIALDQATLLFGVVAPFIAFTRIEISATYYSATATYTFSYIALTTITDPLSNTGVQAIIKIGTTPNVTSFTPVTDYVLSGDTVDWTPNTQAVVAALGAGPYVIVAGVNDKLRFSVNGLALKTVTFPAGPQTAAALATLINQALIADPAYGPLYGAVASSFGGLSLTSPNQFLDQPIGQGVNSFIEFFDTPANSVTTLFGIASAQLPYMKTGTANQPIPGATYYVTYTFVRPATDYNSARVTEHLFFNEFDALNYTGNVTADNVSYNKLGLAASVAFDNKAPRVILIQVDDASSPGFPTVNEVKRAIDAAASNGAITDIAVLDTREAVAAYLVTHVTDESTALNKHYRLGWHGMARNTPVGDIDTPNSFVQRARQTLSVPPDSPGRGRSILTAPANISRKVTLPTAAELRVLLDSTYLAVATAAKKTSFNNPATALLRKTLVGFEADDFQTYEKGERSALASNGVNVITINGSVLTLTDPVTTEQGGGNIIQFIEISAMAQKDTIVRIVDKALDENMVGIVPSDMTTFLNDVKGLIAAALDGAINAELCGRYVDSNGNARSINITTDIQVMQDAQDKRKFRFRYWFNLRYPARNFDGVYSVDNPFYFGAQANTIQTS